MASSQEKSRKTDRPNKIRHSGTNLVDSIIASMAKEKSSSKATGHTEQAAATEQSTGLLPASTPSTSHTASMPQAGSSSQDAKVNMLAGLEVTMTTFLAALTASNQQMVAQLGTAVGNIANKVDSITEQYASDEESEEDSVHDGIED